MTSHCRTLRSRCGVFVGVLLASSVARAQSPEKVPLVIGGSLFVSSYRLAGAQLDLAYGMDRPTAAGWYEGGFEPKISIGIGGIGSGNFLPIGQAGVVSASNLGADELGKSESPRATLFGYPDLLRASSEFIEADLLGALPFFPTGLRFRLPIGLIDAHWVPFEVFTARNLGYSYSGSGAMGTTRLKFSTTDRLEGRLKVNFAYMGGNDLGARLSGVGIFMLAGAVYDRALAPGHWMTFEGLFEYLISNLTSSSGAPLSGSIGSFTLRAGYKHEF